MAEFSSMGKHENYCDLFSILMQIDILYMFFSYLSFHVYANFMMSFFICFATSTFTYCVICFASLRDLINHINGLSIYVFLTADELRLQHRNVFNYVFLINVYNYLFLINVYNYLFLMNVFRTKFSIILYYYIY